MEHFFEDLEVAEKGRCREGVSVRVWPVRIRLQRGHAVWKRRMSGIAGGRGLAFARDSQPHCGVKISRQPVPERAEKRVEV